MKNLMITLFSVLNIGVGFSQMNLPYTANFNSGIPSGWTQGGGGWWTNNTTMGYGNSGCAFVDKSTGNVVGSAWFQSPALDLTSTANNFLSFKFAVTGSSGGASPNFSLWYDIGAGWQFMEDWGGAGMLTTNSITILNDTSGSLDTTDILWYSVTRNLSAFSNQSNIRFSFGADYVNGFGTYNAGWVLLDDVQFTGTSTAGIEEETIDHAINLFPNPSTDLIHIDSDLSMDNYSISNLLGQTVLEGSISNQTIDVSSLEKNIYFLTMMDKNGKKMITKKISKL